MPEPYEPKGSRTVLRRESGSNPADLVDYACKEYRDVLASAKMIGSMSRKGDCYDNACAESFFHTLKTELGWEFATIADARYWVADYIECFYKRRRLHSFLGYMAPSEFERAS